MSEEIEVMISEEDVEKRIKELGKQISKDYEGKTLKKYFVNEKVDRFKRHTIPLLASEKRVNYIIGYRICESVKITEKTETVLKITVRRIFDE